MAQAEPIIFIHGLFAVLAQPQEPDTFSIAQFFAPNPVSIPDLPGYGTNRHYPFERAASVTIQPGVGHMMMLEDQPGFLSIIRQLIK